MWFLSQLPASAPEAIGAWLFGGASVLAIVGLWKRVFERKPPIEAEFVSRIEWAAARNEDKQSGVTLTESITEFRVAMQRDLKDMDEKMERRAIKIHERINEIDRSVAAINERTLIQKQMERK